MATQTFTSGPEGWFVVRLTYTETVNVSANTSTLSVYMECRHNKNTVAVTPLFPDGTITVNGNLLTNKEDGCSAKTFNSSRGSHVCNMPESHAFVRVKKSADGKNAVWTTTVSHNEDGTGTASIAINATLVPTQYYPIETVSGSWNITLTRITRPSSFTVSGTQAVGQTITANITKVHNSDVNTLFWRLETESASNYRQIGSANTSASSIAWNTMANKDLLMSAQSGGEVDVVLRLQTQSSDGTQTPSPTYKTVTLSAVVSNPSTFTFSPASNNIRVGDSVSFTITAEKASYTHTLEWRLKSETTYTTIATLAAGVTSATWDTGASATKKKLNNALSDGKVAVVFKLTTTSSTEYFTKNYTAQNAVVLRAMSTDATEITSVTGTKEIGQTLTIKFSPAEDTYTHQLAFSVDGGSTYTNIGSTIAAGTKQKTWDTSSNATALYNACPNSTSVSVKLRLKTITLNDYSYETIMLSVPSDIKPSLGLGTPAPGGALAGENSVFKTLFVSGISTAVIPISSASAGTGATITSLTVEGYADAGSKTINYTSSIETPTITRAADASLKVTVTDSRGRKVSKTKSITITKYSAPTITADAFRCDSGGNADPATGTRLNVSATMTYSDIPNNDIQTLSYRVKNSDGTWVASSATLTNGTPTITSASYPTLNSYRVYVYYRDKVQQALGYSAKALTFNIASAAVPFNLHAPGDGAAFGEYAQSNYFTLASNLTFYPKGAVQGADWTAADTNKATLLAAFKAPTLVAFTVSATSGVEYTDATVSGVTTDSRVIVQRRTSTTATTLQEPYPVECAVVSDNTLRIFWNAPPSSTGNVAIVAYIVY